MFSNLNKREKLLIAIVASAFTIYLYLSIFIIPIVSEINETKSFIKEKSYILKNNLINEKEKINSGNTLSMKTIPEVESNYEIAYNIKLICDKNKIEFEGLAFNDILPLDNTKYDLGDKADKRPCVLPASITVAGSNNDLIKLFSAIENDKGLCEIADVKINQTTTSQAVAFLNLKYYCYFGGD